MITNPALGTTARPSRSALPAVLVLLAAVAVGVVVHSHADPTRDGASAPPHRATPGTSAMPTSRVSSVRADDGARARPGPAASLRDDGAVQGVITVFAVGSAAVGNLDPALLQALQTAATKAGDDGVEFHVNSGWRSAAYQEQLLREAVAEYGSKKEAERWVATPETSAHVSGDAVDLGPSDATSWLSQHGAPFGLCQIYRNEPWHYELRPEAVDHGCPAMYADPTQDPRMQR